MGFFQEIANKAKLRVERARADYGVVDIAVRTFKRHSEDRGGFAAAGLTYYMFLSIFPLILFSAAILGYLTFGNQELGRRLITAGIDAAPMLRDVLSPEGLGALQDRRQSLALTGVALAVYSGSGAVVALQHALNRIYRVDEEPKFLEKRLRSLKWLASAGLAAVLSVALSSIARFTGSLDELGPAAGVISTTLGHLGAILVSFLIFTAAFKMLPDRVLSWREVLPGALAAALAFEVLKFGGSWYLARGEAMRNETFGAFATGATLLIASYLLAQVTLLAAELNAVLGERRRMRRTPLHLRIEGGDVDDRMTTETVYQDGRATEKSAGQLMKEVTEDLSTLFRKEVELAKQEISSSVAEKLKGAAIIAIAGLFGFFALIFLLLALRDGLDEFLWTWVADIATGALLILIGVLAALFARKKLATPITAELTKRSIKEDVELAKSFGRR